MPGRAGAGKRVRPPVAWRAAASAVLGLLVGRIRLRGRRRLFLRFPALFGFEPGQTLAHRWLFHLRHWRRRDARPAA